MRCTPLFAGLQPAPLVVRLRLAQIVRPRLLKPIALRLERRLERIFLRIVLGFSLKQCHAVGEERRRTASALLIVVCTSAHLWCRRCHFFSSNSFLNFSSWAFCAANASACTRISCSN